MTYRIDKNTLPHENLKRALEAASVCAYAYTMGHVVKRGGILWSPEMQLLHVNSELAEVYEAIRHDESIEQIAHEIVDLIMSSFTALDIMLQKYYENSVDAMSIVESVKRNAINEVVDKITNRLIDDSYVTIGKDNKTKYQRVENSGK